MDSPWRAEGEWLRAALHEHSTNSDGELSARGVAQHYGAEVLDTTADGLIVAARLDRPENAPFARVEVVDGYGRKAWTNPL